MPYTHGGDIYGDAAVELDFSVNTNRLGMPQAVRDAVMVHLCYSARKKLHIGNIRMLYAGSCGVQRLLFMRQTARRFRRPGSCLETVLRIFYMQLSQRFGPNRRFCWHRDFRSMSRRFGCAAARSGGFI